MTKKTNARGGPPHPMDIHAGSKLRARRLLLGMSQEALGNKVGVTFQQVQKYERGTNRLSVSRVYEMSKALEVPVDYFFDGFSENAKHAQPGFSDNDQDGFEAENASEADLMSRRETIKLVRAYYAIKDESLRKQVLSMARALGKSSSED